MVPFLTWHLSMGNSVRSPVALNQHHLELTEIMYTILATLLSLEMETDYHNVVTTNH